MYQNLLPLLEKWFQELDIQGFPIPDDYGLKQLSDPAKIEKAAEKFMERMSGNFPFHRPEYAGQMLKPPHPAAWLAYAMAMSINPNNHALDGGPPGSEMEKEVTARLARMFGYEDHFLGHLTSGGTIANLEALWVSGKIHPEKGILYSETAHYTHGRMCGVLGLSHEAVESDHTGKMNVDALRGKLETGKFGTVVVTMGTTGRGMIEPLHHILPVCREYGARVHLDAAYGGFFKLLEDDGRWNPNPWEATGEADSIVIDPHKHGMQPYGCGCVLFRDASVGKFYKHDSPYTYFLSDDLHLGEITLECSRAGASAAAFWFTLELFGLTHDSGFADVLRNCLDAAQQMYSRLEDSDLYHSISQPETDIVCYSLKKGSTTEISAASERIFRSLMKKGNRSVYVSLLKIPSGHLIKSISPEAGKAIRVDSEIVTVLRSVLMKPSHLEFVPELITRLEAAAME